MNPLQLLEDPLRALLDFLHDNANLTYGWSIVVLTVIVRTALLPLVIKQYSSMRSMQMVAPQLKELQRKYKGNRQKLNEELMRFYKENEINPFASCLPLVAQLPIFFALYYVLREFSEDADVSGGDVSFMWVIPDVRLELQEIGWGAFVIVGIYALSQLLSTELSATPNMPDSQRRIMRILPVVVVIFVFQFPVPAGLVLYWMTTNLWTAAQQLVMRHRIGLHVADPEEVEKFNREHGIGQKKGSRTPPREAAAVAAVAEEGADDDEDADAAAEAPAPARRRRRRRRGVPEPDAAAATEETGEPEAVADMADEPDTADAPDAPEDAEPATAPEPAEAPEPATASADQGSRDAGNGGGGGRRRQPRPKGQGKGAAKGSRPASPARSKKKKR